MARPLACLILAGFRCISWARLSRAGIAVETYRWIVVLCSRGLRHISSFWTGLFSYPCNEDVGMSSSLPVAEDLVHGQGMQPDECPAGQPTVTVCPVRRVLGRSAPCLRVHSRRAWGIIFCRCTLHSGRIRGYGLLKAPSWAGSTT